MPRTKSSIGEQALTIINEGLKTNELIKNNQVVKSSLEKLAIKTNSLISLIYCYTLIEDSALDTDDEIINWTIPDVGEDFCASIWNLSSGFYKTAASSQRGAIEMAIISLYFQIKENEFTGNGYNPSFNQWDGGDTSTPNWGTTKPKLKQNQNVKDFEVQYGYCPIQKAHDFFKYLCSFTHNRSISPEDGGGTNAMNMKNHVGSYHQEEFQRICGAMDKAISVIASTWSIIFPQIVVEYKDSDIESQFCNLEELFTTEHAKKALLFVKNKTSIS